MKQKAGDLISPVLNSSVGRLSSFDIPRKFTPTQPLRSLPDRTAVIQAPGLPSPPVKTAASVSKPGWQGNVLGAATTAVGLLGDPFGISEALLGTAGKPNQSRMSLLGGVNTDPLVPNVSSATGANTRRPEGYSSYGTYTVGGIEYDINSGRPTYMPPGSVYPSSSVAPLSPAAERDYQSKKSAVAQQVAQDPALSKYDRDRAAAIASGDQAKMDAVRDQGMAIWAAKYGGPDGLASKVKPGQSGYDAIQRSLYNQGALPVPTLEQLPEGVPTLGPSLLVPQVDPTLNPAGPNYLGGEGPPLMNFADPRFENMSPEDFQKLLNQVNKK